MTTHQGTLRRSLAVSVSDRRACLAVLGAIAASLHGCRCPAAARLRELPTVDYVDVERYLGRWYEIAATPTILSRAASERPRTTACSTTGRSR